MAKCFNICEITDQANRHPHRTARFGIDAGLKIKGAQALHEFWARKTGSQFIRGNIQRDLSRTGVAEESHADGDIAPVGFCFKGGFRDQFALIIEEIDRDGSAPGFGAERPIDLDKR